MLSCNFGEHSGQSEGRNLVIGRRFSREIFLFEFCCALIQLHFATVSQVWKLLHSYKYQKPATPNNLSEEFPLLYTIGSMLILNR